MSAQTVAEAQPRTRRRAVNEVRLVGRISQAPRSGCCRAGTRCGRSGSWCPRPADAGAARVRRWTRSSARSGAAGSAARWPPGRAGDVVEVTGALRRRFFRAGGAAGVAGRGGGERAAGSFVAQGPDEHAEARLGLEGGGLLGQQPVRGDDPQHQVEVRGGQQHGEPPTSGEPGRGPPRPCGGSRSAVGAVGRAGSRSLVQHLDRGAAARGTSRSSVAHRVAVGGDQRVAVPARRPPRSERGRSKRGPGARAAASRSSRRRCRQDPVDGAEEQRGVVLVDQHRQPEVVGAARVLAAGAAGRRRSGGGRRRSAPGSRPARASRAARSLGVADRPDPVALAAAVGELAGRASAASTVRARCAAPRRARGAPAGSGPGSSRISRHPVGQLGGLHGVDRPRAGRPPGRRGSGPVGDVEGADEAADRDAAGGVLVQVDRRRVVVVDAGPAPPTGCSRRGDVAVGPREGAGRRPGRRSGPGRASGRGRGAAAAAPPGTAG